ncbi:MAG TPA: hypothetical protein VFU02_10510, partial [Polyangiaceae bacterium]|nr:hypothetical protein [Polyangiaceae bacterium]
MNGLESHADGAALTARGPLVPLRLPTGDNGVRLLERILSRIVNAVSGSDRLRIARVETQEELERLGVARVAMYQQRHNYLASLFDHQGVDEMDARSFVFAGYIGDTIVASVRLSVPPFEAAECVGMDRLTSFLGAGSHDRYLEMSRLVVDEHCSIRSTSRALLIYAGLLTYFSTSYEHYLGIVRPKVKASFKFRLERDVLAFNIPQRGNHEYHLVKGTFAADCQEILGHHIDVVKSVLNDGGGSDGTPFL